MKRNYDYVLIDSRTGLSDVADICTIELPDVLTVCFTLSDQSIEGAANVAQQISGRYRDRNIRVLPVPMRIEDGEKEKLDIGRSLARIRFEGFPAGMTQEAPRLYWASVEVPYKPFYAFEEILATFGDDPGSPASLLSSFERITDSVTDGRGHLAAPDSGGSPAAVQGDLCPAAAVRPDPGVPELRPRGPDVGRLDRGRADPGRVPGGAAQHHGQRRPGQPRPAGRARAPECPAGHRRAFVGLHAFPRGPGRSGKPCRPRTRPERTGSSYRSGSATSASANRSPTIRSFDLARTGRRPGHREAALGPRPARPALRRRSRHGRAAALPRAGPADLERGRPERRLHRAGRHPGTDPGQAGRRRHDRGGRPGPVRAGRGGQDPAGPGVRAPVHGRLRPGLVGPLGAIRRDQRRPWPSWRERWA